MKVKDLIKKLEKIDSETEIVEYYTCEDIAKLDIKLQKINKNSIIADLKKCACVMCQDELRISTTKIPNDFKGLTIKLEEIE